MTLLPSRHFTGDLQLRPPHSEQFIAEILSDPALYGDGPPHWVQGKSKKPCKSADEADTDRRKLIKVLRKHGKNDLRALVVAERLSRCEPESRCHGGACPCCMRAFQRWLVSAGDQLLKHSAKHGQPAKILSIIPTKAPKTNGGSHV